MRNTFSTALLLGILLTACAQEGGDHSPRLDTIANPAAPGARQPFAAAGAGGGSVMLSWLEPAPARLGADGGESGSTQLVWAAYDGEAWSAPEPIATGTDFFVNWADFPSLAVANGAPVAAHWLQRVPGGTYAYHVNMAFRSPSGDWGDALTPHLDRSASEHGFVSLVPVDDEGVFAIWLDGYKTAGAGVQGADHSDSTHGAHGGEVSPGKVMTLRSAMIHPDGSRGEELEVDGAVCDCCQTSAVRSGNRIVVVYRDRSSAEIRDIYRAAYDLAQRRWSEPVALSTEGWHIEGCPVNGPQVAAFGETVIATWFSAPEGRAASYFAVSRDGGLTFSEAQALHNGDPAGGSVGRVGVSFSREGAALISWVGSDGAVHGRIWRETGLGTAFEIGAIDPSRASGFPRAAGLDAGFLVAWTEPETGIRTVLITPHAE